jgi:hypothetical protein
MKMMLQKIYSGAFFLVWCTSMSACGQTVDAIAPESAVAALYEVPQNVLACRDGRGIKDRLSMAAKQKYGNWCAPNKYGASFDPRFSDAPPEWGSRRVKELNISMGKLTAQTQDIFKVGCTIVSATYHDVAAKSYGRSDYCLIKDDGKWVVDQIVYESRARPFGLKSDFNPQLMNQFIPD